jgi:hypothetical protein
VRSSLEHLALLALVYGLLAGWRLCSFNPAREKGKS